MLSLYSQQQRHVTYFTTHRSARVLEAWQDLMNNASVRFCLATGGILLTMKAFGQLIRWGQPETYGVEVRIANCFSVTGCRLAVYAEAERRSAKRVAGKDAISSVDGDLVINLAFREESLRGEFMHMTRTWCEMHRLEILHYELVDGVVLGSNVKCSDYVPDETTSPQGALNSRSVASSEEYLRSDATEIVDPKSELCRFQSVEAPSFSQKDSCHLVSHSVCRNDSRDTDPSNRLACTTGLHRALDGTGAAFPAWVRINFVGASTDPIDCWSGSGELVSRFRVDLEIDFRTTEQRKAHGFFWRDGTVDDYADGGPVKTFVHVKDPDMFERCVNWKAAQTTRVWESMNV